MKRIYSIIVLLLFALVMQAQIQNKILSFTLGETTKTSVGTYLKKNHIKYKYSDGEYIAYNIDFGGHKFPMVFFKFFQNKLYSVNFRDSDHFNPGSYVESTYRRMNSTISSKYSSYYKGVNGNYTTYEDGKIRLIVEYGFYEGSLGFSILYSHIPSIYKINANNYNEL